MLSVIFFLSPTSLHRRWRRWLSESFVCAYVLSHRLRCRGARLAPVRPSSNCFQVVGVIDKERNQIAFFAPSQNTSLISPATQGSSSTLLTHSIAVRDHLSTFKNPSFRSDECSVILSQRKEGEWIERTKTRGLCIQRTPNPNYVLPYHSGYMACLVPNSQLLLPLQANQILTSLSILVPWPHSVHDQSCTNERYPAQVGHQG